VQNCLKTVGENTADLGGLYIGYDAFMRLLAKKGVTGDELDRQGREFFRAFAYAWMGNHSSQSIEVFETDFHAYDPVRVNGNVYLVDEFYRLFNIKSGKRYLAPADRIEIW
jgi:putative endopeptidase